MGNTRIIVLSGIVLMMLTLSGCEVISDIFSAGVYTGLAIVVLVIIVVVWIVRKLGRGD